MNKDIEAPEEVITTLRGQLQNCVNHLDMVKRGGRYDHEEKINKCIESANKTLYETLHVKLMPQYDEQRFFEILKSVCAKGGYPLSEEQESLVVGSVYAQLNPLPLDALPEPEE